MSRAIERRMAVLEARLPRPLPPRDDSAWWLAHLTVPELELLEALAQADPDQRVDAADPLIAALAAAALARAAGEQVPSLISADEAPPSPLLPGQLYGLPPQ